MWPPSNRNCAYLTAPLHHPPPLGQNSRAATFKENKWNNLHTCLYNPISPTTDQYCAGWPSSAEGNYTRNWLGFQRWQNPCRHHLCWTGSQQKSIGRRICLITLNLHISIPVNSSTSKIRLPSSLRLILVVSVELFHQLASIFEVFKQLPVNAYVSVPGAQNKVAYRWLSLARVQNSFDIPFIRIVNLCWMLFCRWLFHIRWCGVVELWHLENIVSPHCS